MPREKKSRQELLQTWINSDSELCADLCIRGNDLFCNMCGRIIDSSRKNRVTKHVKNHASTHDNSDPEFFYDLTVALLASDIPLNKLNNPTLRHFLEKYMDRKLPHPNTLRNRYVDKVYDDVIEDIRNDIGDNYVYFVIDEATDACGHSVANCLIGTLQPNSAGRAHLVASKRLERTNHSTIVDFVKECFHSVWPNEDHSEEVLVMLTDAAPYMRKAGELLTGSFPNMLHFTCAAHALHRVAEKVRENFSAVNDLIANMKKVFLKAPTRRDTFRETLPGIPLPPEPVVTRWGTWLEAVKYYDTHFEDLKRVICSFDSNESAAIHKVQNLLQLQSLRDDIRYINSNYGILITAIAKLETHGLSLQEQFGILNDVKQKINTHNSRAVSSVIKQKLQDVFTKNPAYNRLEEIWLFRNGTHQELSPPLLKYSSCIVNFSYCPLVTVDVERSFSLRKLLLSDRRRRFTVENLEKYIITTFHYSQQSAAEMD